MTTRRHRRVSMYARRHVGLTTDSPRTGPCRRRLTAGAGPGERCSPKLLRVGSRERRCSLGWSSWPSIPAGRGTELPVVAWDHLRDRRGPRVGRGRVAGSGGAGGCDSPIAAERGNDGNRGRRHPVTRPSYHPSRARLPFPLGLVLHGPDQHAGVQYERTGHRRTRPHSQRQPAAEFV